MMEIPNCANYKTILFYFTNGTLEKYNISNATEKNLRFSRTSLGFCWVDPQQSIYPIEKTNGKVLREENVIYGFHQFNKFL